MDLWHCLTKEDKGKLAQYYEQQFGMKLVPPKKDKRGIKCEAKLESLEEIDRTMKEAPGYAIDVQGREG